MLQYHPCLSLLHRTQSENTSKVNEYSGFFVLFCFVCLFVWSCLTSQDLQKFSGEVTLLSWFYFTQSTWQYQRLSASKSKKEHAALLRGFQSWSLSSRRGKACGRWCWDVNSKRGESLFAHLFPHLLPYLEGSNRAAGCQIQVLSQVEVLAEHGKMSCQKIVVLYSL